MQKKCLSVLSNIHAKQLHKEYSQIIALPLISPKLIPTQKQITEPSISNCNCTQHDSDTILTDQRQHQISLLLSRMDLSTCTLSEEFKNIDLLQIEKIKSQIVQSKQVTINLISQCQQLLKQQSKNIQMIQQLKNQLSK
ncbi:Hypothetical_protein [Hexamita inflata]|uniref:Hypothetical_protein n=1 Tax=Hexamita inflata TaxID=28002 RepID=A0AA86UFN1_9EUKA|nr:Hypothetical protein HINF_LOCUS43920 [Hexamita inflata]